MALHVQYENVPQPNRRGHKRILKMLFKIHMPSPVWDKNVLQTNRRGQERRAQDMEYGGLNVRYENVPQPNRRGHKCRAQDIELIFKIEMPSPVWDENFLH
jgi:hypothetical protein